MKRWLLAAACGAVALGLLLYPLAGELLSEKYHSDVETTYTAAIKDTDDAELTAQRQAAQQYNAMLSGAAITEGGASAPPLAYDQQLTVGSVMCYVDIPKIGVYLPVEHGMSADTLEKSVGHVVGTSLPVGGANTHAVLSAHSGMASSKLFSDIDQLAEGDIFYIHVLGDTLTYQVDNIATVLPTDTSLLQIEDGKDLVTLVTCTPFGVNTHRLLVRGRRITAPDKLKHIRVTSDAIKIEPILTAPIMALPLLLVLLFWLLFAPSKRSSTKDETHKTH